MKATFTEFTYFGKKPRKHGKKKVKLPFERVTARAIIIRRSDHKIFGVQHKPDFGFALPGGGLDHGENPVESLKRELAEEDIRLIGAVEDWEDYLAVDYYEKHKELNLWYLITVDNIEFSSNPEIHTARWLDQAEDVWWPHMRELIVLMINRHLPALASVRIETTRFE